jgi:predicted glycosyltransferase
MSEQRVLIWVQHLLGIGHLKRAALLRDAMQAAGLEVSLVSGGMPEVAGVVQLPPVRVADEAFSHLVDERGQPIDDAFKNTRRDALLAHLDRFRPHALITEMYPFGRRMMRFELEPMLAAAWTMSPRPVIVSSVRDILTQKRKPERSAEMAEKARSAYDHVLVHGDEALIPFNASFPYADRIADMIRYTGYVGASGDTAEPPPGDGEGEVIVSAGGGAVGARLMATAIDAKPHTALAAHRWRLLAGRNMDAAAFDALKERADAGIVVERARSDFRSLLRRAALSISQAGYNTVLDIVGARVPTVLVPFEAAGETEQRMRAEYLAARGLAEAVAESELTPQTLAQAIDRAHARGRPKAPTINVDGAKNSARLVTGMIASGAS